MKKIKILIFGGTGFIGYHLAKNCLKKKWEVTSVSTKIPKKNRYLSNVRYLKCNICNNKNLKKIFKTKFDYVVNLAGYVDHKNKKKTYNSHYLGCKNIVKNILISPPKKFIQIGSSLEYGKLSSPQKESAFCKPLSTYAKAKFFSTKYLLYIYKKYKLPVTILRIYQAYGEKQDSNRFLPIIIKSCLKNKTFPCSEGRQFRDFIYIDDIISAIFKCLKNKNSHGQIFNIGSGKPLQIRKIILNVINIIKGGKPQFGKIKLRKEEALKVYPSTFKAQKLIQWNPKISFSNGLKRTIKYYKKSKFN